MLRVLLLAAAATLQGPKVSTPDAKTLSSLHAFNLAGIVVGQLAEKHGQAPAVRQLGTHLVENYTADDRAVVAAARRLDVPLSTSGSEAQMKRLMLAIPELQEAHASSFDGKFLHALTTQNQVGRQLVRAGQSQASDAEVRRIVAGYQPQLKHYDELAKALYPVSH